MTDHARAVHAETSLRDAPLVAEQDDALLWSHAVEHPNTVTPLLSLEGTEAAAAFVAGGAAATRSTTTAAPHTPRTGYLCAFGNVPLMEAMSRRRHERRAATSSLDLAAEKDVDAVDYCSAAPTLHYAARISTQFGLDNLDLVIHGHDRFGSRTHQNGKTPVDESGVDQVELGTRVLFLHRARLPARMAVPSARRRRSQAETAAHPQGATVVPDGRH